MKLRQKLQIGFGLLFLVVLFFGGLSLFYIRVITNSNNVILQDNYATLRYVDEMRTILESNPNALSRAENDNLAKALAKQQGNVTEPGELQAVKALANDFNRLNSSLEGVRLESRKDALYHLRGIARLNLDAIERKSANAQDRIRNATIYLGGAACLTFVVLFSFVFNLAGFFEAPMQQVSAAMRQVAREKTFQNRLEFDRGDEFGEISTAFNHMSSSLSHWSKERQAMLERERRIAGMLGEQIEYPVIVLSEAQEVLFCNSSAKALFDLKTPADRHSVNGTPAASALEEYANGPITIKETSFLLEIQQVPAAPALTGLDNDDESLNGLRQRIKMYVFRKV